MRGNWLLRTLEFLIILSPMHFLRRSPIFLAAIVILLLGLGLFASEFFMNRPAAISGMVDYNGTIPQGSSIAVAARKLGTSQFQTFLTGITPSSSSSWSFANAKNGSAYEIQAYLQVNGQTVSTSDMITVAAPANGEVLTINSTSQPTNNTASISGTVDLNGPVPPGGSIAIATKSPVETQYNIVLEGLSATDGVSWTWSQAQEGAIYDVKAFLQVNGSNLYESESETVAAPATNEVLTLNARTPSPTPQPTNQPSQQASVRGSINLNGPTPNNATILLVARVTGTSSFQVVASNISPTNGATWLWNNATSGNTYDLQAWLQVNNSTQLQSNIVTVTAPAANEILTINNASNQYPAPNSNTLSTSCQGNNNNMWQVSFNYNTNGGLPTAQQYLLTAGTTSNGNQLVNITATPANPNQQQNYSSGTIFSSNQTYFAQYAYSPCINCNIWSPLSASVQFSCNTPPTQTPTPTTTLTPTPTLTPTMTLTPTPTLPPMTSACNQTCESNGYSCALGLQCVSGNLPGSQVCRNPNCTDRTDCNCRFFQNNSSQ